MSVILEDPSVLSERVRNRLFGIAYRMLGSIEDAEDTVQEAFLRWQNVDGGSIREPEAWMVTVVTRLAIDRLRRVRRERETYAGPWLPEPLSSADSNRPDRHVEEAAELSVAFLVLLERLAPEERAAFLLREVFEVGYDEIAQVLNRSEVACRQVVHRARARVRRGRPRFTVSPEVTEQLLERFISALRTEDKVAMLDLLDDEVTYASDGGGQVRTARRVVHGVLKVGRMLLGLQQKFWRHRLTHRLIWLHGEPAMVSFDAEAVRATTFIATDGTRITALYRVANPEKLRRVPYSAAPTTRS